MQTDHRGLRVAEANVSALLLSPLGIRPFTALWSSVEKSPVLLFGFFIHQGVSVAGPVPVLMCERRDGKNVPWDLCTTTPSSRLPPSLLALHWLWTITTPLLQTSPPSIRLSSLSFSRAASLPAYLDASPGSS